MEGYKSEILSGRMAFELAVTFQRLAFSLFLSGPRIHSREDKARGTKLCEWKVENVARVSQPNWINDERFPH